MKALRFSLRTKLLLSVSLLIVIDSVALGQFFARQEAANIRRSVVSRGVSLARGFAYNSEYGTITADEELLLRVAQGVMRERDVVYCAVHDESGHVLAKLERDGRTGVLASLDHAAGSEPFSEQGVEVDGFDLAGDEHIYQFACPIYIQRQERTAEEISLLFGEASAGGWEGVGGADIGGAPASLTADESADREMVGRALVGISLAEMNSRLARGTRLAILLTLLVVGVSLSLTVPIIQAIVEPIRDLVLGTKRIAHGDLSIKVPVQSRDEIGKLADSFNQMVDDLRCSREEIEEYNRTLEQRVAERTADLEKRNREILALNRSLRETQEQLITSARLAAMGEMSAEIGHELNNYIAVISGRADLIPLTIEKGAFDKAIENARTIAEQTSRIQVLTNGLMDSSRRDTRQMNCDLTRLIADTVDFVKPQNKYDKVQFHIDIGQPVPMMRLDPQQMQQVLLNLLSNAADAIGPEREGHIRVRSRWDREADEVVVEVQDDGPGVPGELLQRIFEPSFTTKKHGHGFGLAVCHRVVTNHRGTISVSSNPEWGTVFRIALPAGQGAEGPKGEPEDARAESESPA